MSLMSCQPCQRRTQARRAGDGVASAARKWSAAGAGSLRRATLAFLALLGVATPAAAGAQTVASGARGAAPHDTLVLRIADVRRLALTQNPAFLADRQELAAARGGLRQASVIRFNPDLTVAAPGAGTTSLRNPLEATLLQEVEVAGQRGLRRDAARVAVSRAAAGIQNSARLGVADATLAFYRALSAERRLAVTRDGLTLTTRLMNAVRTQLREGEISALEGTLAEIEFGRARARVLEAERLAAASMLELKRLVGIETSTPVRLEDPLAPAPVMIATLAADSITAITAAAPPNSVVDTLPPSVALGLLPDPAALDADSLLSIALARRPDLAASDAAIREFEALTVLARREAFPNLRLGALAERVPNENGMRIGPAIGLTLPFWNRNQGLVEQRRAEVQQALLQRQAVELRVRTDVETAVLAYRAAVQEASAYESTVRQPARINSALLETAFRAGKIALPTLLLLRNQLIDAELGYWTAWLARQNALVELDAATGLLALDALRAADASPTPLQKDPR